MANARTALTEAEFQERLDNSDRSMQWILRNLVVEKLRLDKKCQKPGAYSFKLIDHSESRAESQVVSFQEVATTIVVYLIIPMGILKDLKKYPVMKFNFTVYYED